MPYETRPVPRPKPAVACRSKALEDQTLVDASELEGADAACELLPLPTAVSAFLLDLIEQTPYGAPHCAVRDRVRGLLEAAAGAYQRAREHYAPHFAGALMHGFVVDFCTDLPRRASERRYRFVRLHCGPDDGGNLVATLGLPSEL